MVNGLAGLALVQQQAPQHQLSRRIRGCQADGRRQRFSRAFVIAQLIQYHAEPAMVARGLRVKFQSLAKRSRGFLQPACAKKQLAQKRMDVRPLWILFQRLARQPFRLVLMPQTALEARQQETGFSAGSGLRLKRRCLGQKIGGRRRHAKHRKNDRVSPREPAQTQPGQHHPKQAFPRVKPAPIETRNWQTLE